MLRPAHDTTATDATIKTYVQLASKLGHRGAEWEYEWRDSGGVVFTYRTVELIDRFDASLALHRRYSTISITTGLDGRH